MRYLAFPIFTAALAAFSALSAAPAFARKLTVGPGKAYAKPSLAAAAAQKGDTVEFDPIVYESDACTWSDDDLVLRAGPAGSKQRAHLKSNGTHAAGKGIWVIDGKNLLVENIEFSGAKVPDENGAGIRQQASGITIRNCYFHDNENGILGVGSDMVIEYTEFAHNGLGDRGYTHNIYISEGTSFTLRHSYIHHAVIGHNVKTRAARNFILYNRIMDEADGTSSYDIDMPDGGFAVILGNTIQQGPDTDNSIIIAYAAEAMKHTVNELYLVSNTIVNDRSAGTFISIARAPTVSKAMNNLFVGPGSVFSGTVKDTGGNVVTQSPGFANRAGFDYHISSASPAVDKGVDAGSAGGMPLAPAFQYVHNSGRTERNAVGKLDAGAFENGVVDALHGPEKGHKRNGRSAAPFAGPGLAIGPDHFLIPVPEGGWGFDLVGARLPAGY